MVSHHDAGLADAFVELDGAITDAGAQADAYPHVDRGVPATACDPTPGDLVLDGDNIFCSGAAHLAMLQGIDSPHLDVLADIQIIGR